MTRAVYNATPPTKADKAQFELQCDEHGNLKVVLATGSVDQDVTIVAPLGTQAIAASVAVTPATSSTWAVTGPMTSAEFLANMRATPAFTSVNSANSSTQLLAANASRKGVIIVNTDANALYIDVTGGTAATTRYAKALAQNEQWQCPFAPVTAITGIWAADGSGAALITEY